MIAVANGARLLVGRIGARLRLGQSVGAERAARGELRENGLLLLGRAEFPDRIAGHGIVHRDDDRRRGAHARQLLDDEDEGQGVRAGTAEFLGNHHSKDPHLRELAQDLAGELLLLLPICRSRSDLRLGELANGVADALLFVRELEVHGVRAGAGPGPGPGPEPGLPPRPPRRRRRERRRELEGRASPRRGGGARPRGRRRRSRPRTGEGTPRGPAPPPEREAPGRPCGGFSGGRGAPPRLPPRRRRRREGRGSGVSVQPSSRWRNVTRISDRLARSCRNPTSFARRGPWGSAASAGILSASKSVIRVQPTVLRRPSGASRITTKRSLS